MANPGFFKNDNGTMLYAANSIVGPSFSFVVGASNQPMPSAPVDGWAYYDSDVAAFAALGLTMPPPPSVPGQSPQVISMQITSTLYPVLNGDYPIDAATQGKMMAISLYVVVNGKFPNGQSGQVWPDVSGNLHVFPTTAEWQAFSTATADYIAALDVGQSPSQPVAIP